MGDTILYVLDKSGNLLTWIPSSARAEYEKDFILQDTDSEVFDWLYPLHSDEEYFPAYYFFDKGFCLATIYLNVLDCKSCKVLNFNDIMVECETIEQAKELCLRQKTSLNTLKKKGLT